MKNFLKVVLMLLAFITLNLEAGDGVPVINTNIFSFNVNLTVGTVGVDVVMLRRVLGVPYTGDDGADYFGIHTKLAVMKFQVEHGIPATGFVGPLTRAALNGLELNQFVNIDRLHIVKPVVPLSYVSIMIEGQPLAYYNLEVSTDLKTWKSLRTFDNASTGVLGLKFDTDELFPNSATGFFRLTRVN